MSKEGSVKLNGIGHAPVSTEAKKFEISVISDFQIEETIAHGQFGSVYKAREPKDAAVVAFKCYYASVTPSTIGDKPLLLHGIHPYLVNFYSFVADAEGRIIGHVMEYMTGGSLHNVIHSPDRIYTYSHFFSWVFQAADGLNHLHMRKIVHGEIMPTKLLFTGDLQTIKINCMTLTELTERAFYDTAAYMAPETVKCDQIDQLTCAADVYAFGIIVWELLTRINPYGLKQSRYTMLKAVLKGERPNLDKVDEVFHYILSWSWKADPNLRPTMVEFAKELQSIKKKLDLNGQIKAPEEGRTGEAIEVLIPSKDGKHLVLQLDKLKAMFVKEGLLKKKIALISISGFNRTGKSTILNYVLASLAEQSCVNNNDFIFLSNTEKHHGFQCKKVSDKELKGVQIWSIPYFVERDGTEFAVLLLDSSGLSLDSLFDSLLISAVCSTFSAIRLFNCLNFLKKDDLYYVLIADQLSKTKPPSQHTCFLIRNWPEGVGHEQEFLKEKVKEISTDRSNATDRMSCFFFSSKENKTAFNIQVSELIKLIFKELKPIQFGCTDVTGETFLEKLQELVEQFHFPESSQNLHQVYLQQVFQTALEKAEESFTNYLQACINNKKEALNKETLNSYFNKSANVANKVFEENCKGFHSAEKKSYEQKLSASFTECYHTYRIHVEQLQSTERRLEKAVKSIENTRNQMERALTGIKHPERPLEDVKSTGTSTDPSVPSSSATSETGSRRSTFSRSETSRTSRKSQKHEQKGGGFFGNGVQNYIGGAGVIGALLIALAKWKGILITK